MIEQNFRKLRSALRNNSKVITDHILENNLNPNNTIKANDICMFCASNKLLTKEHVLPRWVFQKCTKRHFITDVNGNEQTFNKTTIPTCSNCNNNHLAKLEKYVIKLVNDINLEREFFSGNELHAIIRWLEIIEYKFHVLEFRRKFKSSKSSGNIPFLTNIPISVLRKNINFSPVKAVAQLRESQKRVTVKDKTSNINSLVLFRSKNESAYFFHTMNEYIFLELPEFKIAIFYFFSKKFDSGHEAHDVARKIVNSVYKS